MSRKSLLLEAITLGAAAAAGGWAFSQWEGALRIVLIAAITVVYIAWALPSLGVRLLDSLLHSLRAFHWREEQGRHHAFAGLPLRIEDDGRYVWVDAAGLQRVLGKREPDDAVAARHSDRWKRTADGELYLRVDAVVDVLAHGPGRLDPRTIKLRRYFEREVLFPAAERRKRQRA